MGGSVLAPNACWHDIQELIHSLGNGKTHELGEVNAPVLELAENTLAGC